MGLDMYLYAKKFLWTKRNPITYEEVPLEPNPLTQDLTDLGVSFTPRYFVVEAGYWRKSNQIHKWFVDNVQEGNDNCGTYFVSRGQLEGLRDVCRKVIDKELTPEALPPEAGFFFGSTAIDDGYWEDLRDTVEQLDDCLKYPSEWEFEYHSSW